MADKKPKEGVRTENNDHINLEVAGQGGSVVQFKIQRQPGWRGSVVERRPMILVRGLSTRQIRFRLDGQPINETLHSWTWRVKVQVTCSSSRQEGSANKGTCYLTPELVPTDQEDILSENTAIWFQRI
ncbi:hypothetical protein QTO34_014815 [Cnephaeus nilssonii]|uniref:Uncharacterized protein n=1 Tax=Cnephaeus nilssonii TaxID=3371016 RepID=A0AA40LSM9_CNENI|nr:hypothetical protein QTO34_014815 [Eptesicus nilssonii]